jgi:hypothetical protein
MAQEIVERIEKDIRMFHDSVGKLRALELSERERDVVDLAEDYCKDAGSWLAKGDYYTSFASVSYAHGLLDALLKIRS